jgi:peptidoglycan hydrolase CwlO-like protein
METNKIKYNVIILILLIVIGGFIYALMFKPANGVIDTSHYDKTVDSLNIEINKHNLRVDSLTASISERNKKIDQYTNELGKLKNKLDKEKKAHEADINRINAMSNADIASEFTNAFE